jgi:uncharacterized protein YndB with AHSA1/START domain
MSEFRTTIEIDAAPERVWEVLGDITSVSRWIPGVVGVTPDGMTRVCAFEDGHVQTERIHDYSPGGRSYRYAIDGAPLPVADNVGRFAVEEDGGRVRVVWESSFRALDPAAEDELARMWAPYLPVVLGNLKRVVEDGA